MALDLGTLVGYLKVEDRDFNSGLDRAENRMGVTGGVIGKVAKVAGAAALAGIGAAVVGGVRQFAQLESGMNEVFTLLPGISKGAMDKMTGQVKDFAVDFGVLPNDVVPALYQSLSAGVPPGNVFEFLETAQMAAKGGVTELTTAVDGISSVVNAYGDDVVNATQASDLMFTAVKLGKTNFEELSASLFNVTPTAAALGVKFGDVTASIAAMTAQGTPTSVATTQMRQMLVELSKAGSATSDTFKEVAGVGFKQFIAEGGNTQDALKLLGGHAKKTGVGINDLFGSVEAGSAALALTGKGSEKFSDSLKGMQDSSGATEAAFEQMDQGLSASWDKIKAAGAVALADLGAQLAPLVSKMAGWAEVGLPMVVGAVGSVGEALTTVSGIVSSVNGFLSQHDTLAQVLAVTLGTVLVVALTAWGTAAVVNAGKNVGAWFATSVAAKKAGVTTQRTAMQMVVRWAFLGVQSLLHAAKVAAAWFIALGPVGWVIATVIGLVALIILNWDKIKKFTGAAWDWIVSKVTGAWDDVKTAVVRKGGEVLQWFADLPGKIKDGLGDVGELLKDKGIAIVQGLWDGIKSMGGWIAGQVAGFVEDVIPGPIRKALGISSPSRVMRDLARHVPEGMALGIQDGLRDVQTAAGRMAQATIPALGDAPGPRRPGDRPGGAGGGATIKQYFPASATPEAAAAAAGGRTLSALAAMGV